MGYAASEIEQNYSRAYDICRGLGEVPQQAPALYGLWVYHLLRGHREDAWELSSQLHQFATISDPPLVTRSALAITTFYGGNCREARELLEDAKCLYAP